MNKKAIPIIASMLSLILISSLTIVATNLMANKPSEGDKEEKPLNRGDNYKRFILSPYIEKNKNLPSIISGKIVDGKYKEFIDENKLKVFLKNNLSEILKEISEFKSKASLYAFDIHYRISKDGSYVLIDLVWNLPNTRFYYYDQLKLFML